MCKKGNQCNRTLCFFAHSASELRFPDTEDDAQAAAVDAAAASASATPLPLCQSSMASNSANISAVPQHAGVAMMQSVAGSSNNSLPLMHIGSMCSDASTATAVMGNLDGSSSYSIAALQAAGLRQGSCASQLTGIVDDMSGSYGLGGSDPGFLLQGLANQAQQQQAQHSSNSLSEPLPRLGANSNSIDPNAWLQLATASQLPASQILSSIRPPGASSVAAAQQAQQRQMLQQAANYAALGQAAQKPHGAQMAAFPGSSAGLNSNMMMMNGGSGSSSHPLVQPARMDSSAEQLVASLNGLQLQGGLADDRSGSLTSASATALADRYAALASGRPVDASMLQGTMNAQGAGVNSSRAEDFLLLQMLQEKQVQQQQQQAQAQMVQMGSGGHTLMQGQAGQSYTQVPTSLATPQPRGKLNWGFGLGM